MSDLCPRQREILRSLRTRSRGVGSMYVGIIRCMDDKGLVLHGLGSVVSFSYQLSRHTYIPTYGSTRHIRAYASPYRYRDVCGVNRYIYNWQ